MADEPRSDELKTLWQQQPTDNTYMSIEELRAKASVLERRIRRRNTVEYLGAAAVIGFSVTQLVKAPGTVVRVGSLC